MMNDYDAEFDSYRDRSGRPSSGLRWISMLVIVLFVFGFFALVWYAYNQSISSSPDGDDLAVITPDEPYYKQRPDDAGGLDIAGSELESYELLRREPDARAEAGSVERLTPGSEQPMTVKPAVTKEQKEARAIDEATSNMSMRTPAPVNAPEAGETETFTPQASSAVPAPSNVPTAGRMPPVAAEADRMVKPTPAPVKKAAPAPAAKPAVKKTPPAPVVASNGVYVQFAALSSEKEAHAMWKRLQDKHAGLLADKTHYVQSVNVAGKGTLYRLRAKGFTSRDAAMRICTTLKQRGQDCLVSK